MTTLAAVASEAALECVDTMVEALSTVWRTTATPARVAEHLVSSDVALILDGEADAPNVLAERIDACLMELERRGFVMRTGDGYLPTKFIQASSCRQHVLSLVARAARAHGRAVRLIDVWRFATRHAPEEVEAKKLTPTSMQRAMNSLKTTGDLTVVGRVRAPIGEGRNLVVCADEPPVHVPHPLTEPLTWLDYVVYSASVVATANTVRDSAASYTFTMDELVRFLRDEVRLGSSPSASTFKVSLDDNRRLTVALEGLAQEKPPLIAPVPGRRATWRWNPDVAQDTTQVTTPGNRYASDTDRVMEAARRICERENRLTVTAKEVAAEVGLDPALRLTGKESVAKVLSGLARSWVMLNVGNRQARRDQRLRRVGSTIGAARYWVVSTGSDTERAEAEAEAAGSWAVRMLEDEHFQDRFHTLERVVSPIVAIGRARQLRSDIRTALRALPNAGDKVPTLQAARADAERTLADIEGWLRFREHRHPEAPAGYSPVGRGFTAEELRRLYAPLSPTVADMTTHAEIVRHYSRLLRRTRNPEFVNRRAEDAVAASQFLFEPADAMAYAAREWGGTTSSLMARWGIEEVGELRDPRFVLQSLEIGRREERVRAIAGLALMQCHEAEPVLTRHARDNADASVREAALWALGMVIGDRAADLLREAARVDPDLRLQRRCAQWLALGDRWWWRV